ncbi:MAG: YbhB/YbcL family Raf kinase inhibitor-like protein, partial [Chitinophaga rupis]
MKRKSTTEAAVVTTMYPPLMITNPIFGDNKPILRQYTRDGANINPQLDIAGTPSTAKSLAVIMEDPDGGLHNWVHWVAWNIPVIRTLREARIMEAQGRNDFMEDFYDGPCPPYGT